MFHVGGNSSSPPFVFCSSSTAEKAETTNIRGTDGDLHVIRLPAPVRLQLTSPACPERAGWPGSSTWTPASAVGVGSLWQPASLRCSAGLSHWQPTSLKRTSCLVPTRTLSATSASMSTQKTTCGWSRAVGCPPFWLAESADTSSKLAREALLKINHQKRLSTSHITSTHTLPVGRDVSGRTPELTVEQNGHKRKPAFYFRFRFEWLLGSLSPPAAAARSTRQAE